MRVCVCSCQFQEMTESLVQSCRSDVDSFLRDLDRSVAQSRDIFHLFDLLHGSSRGVQEEVWMKVQEKVQIIMQLIINLKHHESMSRKGNTF